MYAVLQIKGKQYKVSEGDVIDVDSMGASAGDSVDLEKIILLVNEDKIIVDKSSLKNIRITAEIMGDGRKKKIVVFKYKPKKGYKRMLGHRQNYTRLKIKNINLDA